jgi:4-hydroxy 2-oxovalerate aldolase
MYRPEIRILDCTIRDGGLMNDHRFTTDLVRKVFDACARSGVDYCELGYRCDKEQFSTDKFGPWKFCDEEHLREVAYECGTKVSVMADVGRTDYKDIIPKKNSIVSMYRVATYCKDIDKAIDLGRHAKEQGYEVSVNIMSVSHVLEPELDEALGQLAETNFDVVYLVDSFGYLYSEPVHYLANKYLKVFANTTIEVGIHCHNNQQLAFANTVEGIIRGINFLDGSIYGMGRAAGNCTTELLLGFLKNPRYNIQPVLDLIEEEFVDLQAKLKWGYFIPYMVAGILNKHPRSAMALMKDRQGVTYGEYFKRLSLEGEEV